MRTLHPAYRVTDLVASLDFYIALGYSQVGRVDMGDGASLTMLKLPDDEVVALELVHRPADGPVFVGTGFSHVAVQVDNLSSTLESLSRAGLQPGPTEHPGGPAGPKTSWLKDPDGYRLELVQWPPGHSHGITAADFATSGQVADERG
jgi:lactoylglutathione lyase